MAWPDLSCRYLTVTNFLLSLMTLIFDARFHLALFDCITCESDADRIAFDCRVAASLAEALTDSICSTLSSAGSCDSITWSSRCWISLICCSMSRIHDAV